MMSQNKKLLRRFLFLIGAAFLTLLPAYIYEPNFIYYLGDTFSKNPSKKVPRFSVQELKELLEVTRKDSLDVNYEARARIICTYYEVEDKIDSSIILSIIQELVDANPKELQQKESKDNQNIETNKNEIRLLLDVSSLNDDNWVGESIELGFQLEKVDHGNRIGDVHIKMHTSGTRDRFDYVVQIEDQNMLKIIHRLNFIVEKIGFSQLKK